MEGVFVGYRYYDRKNMDALFPFGHSLSYTTFSYSNLRFNKEGFKDIENVQCHVDVTNIGPVFGKCVVQLYVSDNTNYENRPLKELKGFKKLSLQPGEMKTVDIELNKRSFEYWNTEIHDWYAPTSEYEILIGNSSRDIRIQGKVHVESTKKNIHFVTNNSTFVDVYDDPITKPALDKLLADFPNQKEWMDSNDEEHEFWRICVRDFSTFKILKFLIQNHFAYK